MEIRELIGDERERAWPLWSQAFERGDREMREWREFGEANKSRIKVYGVLDAAGLQAAVAMMDCRLSMGADLVLPMVAVEGVACLPAARGKGYASAGVLYALERAREAGHILSILDPFSWEFYRKLGWDWIGVRRRYTVPTRILKSDPETVHVRAAAMPADREAIQAIYRQFAADYRGMLVRTDFEWDQILNDKPTQYTYTYLYERDGRPEGYLTYRGGKEETSLREFLCLTPRAQRGLLGLLRRHEMQTNKVAWDAPCDDRLWSLITHWDVETHIRPVTMGRIVDAAGALRAWKPADEARGQVTLAVSDERAPWNTGTWQVEFAEGSAEVQPTTTAPQVTLDIQALSQAYFGTPTLDDLRAAERLVIHDEAGYAALRALLAGPPMWVNDDF